MAAGVNTVNSKLVVNQYDISSLLREISREASFGTYDNTTLGQSSRTKQLGISTGGVQVSGLFTRATGEAYDVFSSALGSATPKIATVYPEGFTAGYPAELCYANESKFDDSVKYDDLTSVSAYLESAEDAVDFGVSLQDLAAVTGTGNGTDVDNGAATTNGGVAVLHTTAIAGASPSVTWKVQHSTDGSTWADLSGATFTAQTAAGAQRLEVAAGTTVNRHLRAVRTFGGTTTSITSTLAFARR